MCGVNITAIEFVDLPLHGRELVWNFSGNLNELSRWNIKMT